MMGMGLLGVQDPKPDIPHLIQSQSKCMNGLAAWDEVTLVYTFWAVGVLMLLFVINLMGKK